jgi:glycosyltransferase involved in cell wall biosynthesis
MHSQNNENIGNEIDDPHKENAFFIKNSFNFIQDSQIGQDKAAMNSVGSSDNIQDSSSQVNRQGTKDIVFLVWAPSSSRAEGLANALDARLCKLNYKFKRKAYSPIKYPLLFARSLKLLSMLRPNTIICQEPPAFCTAAAMTYRCFQNRKARIVIDAHTAAFKAPWSYFKLLHKFLLDRAFLVIVTNDELRDAVMKQYGVRPFVLQDRIALMEGDENTHYKNSENHHDAEISLPQKTKDHSSLRPTNATTAKVTKGQYITKPNSQGSGPLRVVVICSFSPDEPITEVLQASRMLPEIEFYITGDYTRALERLEKKITPNVILTGYLNRNDYAALLRSADTIIALTKRDNTMLSGANEAFALSKPLITTGWPSLRNYFGNAAVYVSNHHTPEEIAEAVNEVGNKKTDLVKESEQLKNLRNKEWQDRFENFKAILMQASELPDSLKNPPDLQEKKNDQENRAKTSATE